MNFQKYPSLVNHYAIGKNGHILKRYNDLWYATEKIHGANASIVMKLDEMTSDIRVKFAKRSGFIEYGQDKQFNRFVKLAKSLSRRELLGRIEELLYWNGVTQVYAFGEYFGSSVQKMNYDISKNNEVDFLLFNIILEYGDGEIHYVLGRDLMEKVIGNEYLVPVSSVNTLKSLLQSELSDDSIYGGMSEGLVYQPIHGYVFNDYMKFTGVKHKTEKFSEIINGKSEAKRKVYYTPEFLALIDDVGMFLTENRMNNVLSHGELELIPKNIGKIMIEFKEDLIKEFLEERESLELNIADSSKNADKKEVVKAVSTYNAQIALMIKQAIKDVDNIDEIRWL